MMTDREKKLASITREAADRAIVNWNQACNDAIWLLHAKLTNLNVRIAVTAFKMKHEGSAFSLI